MADKHAAHRRQQKQEADDFLKSVALFTLTPEQLRGRRENLGLDGADAENWIIILSSDGSGYVLTQERAQEFLKRFVTGDPETDKQDRRRRKWTLSPLRFKRAAREKQQRQQH